MTNLRTAMNRGAFDFVTKPVDLHDLEITVRKTLDDIASYATSSGGGPRPSAHAATCPGISRPTSSRCWRQRDEPLGAVRRQTVAVLFVDIVGFTRMAEPWHPKRS